jgi:PKHD-type hydroxylase
MTRITTMILTIAHVLDDRKLAEIHTVLARLPFEPGTAGWATSAVKRNTQAAPTIDTETLTDALAAMLLAHDVFDLVARPKRIMGPMISRYAAGDAYGAHVDDPILDGARADLAFTVFLSDFGAYDGGDLVISSPAGDEAIKLPAGSVVLYPATTLHRVAPVTRGVRHAAVGWVRSLIRRADQRELLFDLDTARRALFDRHGKTTEFDTLTKTSANLMRMWVED